MIRLMVVLGLVGLGVAVGVTPANAVPMVTQGGTLICHANGDGTFTPVYVRPHGWTMNIAGHGNHEADIIPTRISGGEPQGRNMTPENVATYKNGCVVPATAPVAQGQGMEVVPAPKAAQPRSQGYNVDTVVERQPDDVAPMWLAAAAGILPAAILILWRSRYRPRRTTL